jgi:hypothetical protein
LSLKSTLLLETVGRVFQKTHEQVLLCSDDGFGLQAWLIERGEFIRVLAFAETDATDCVAALGEVFELIAERSGSSNLPDEAIMVTNQAVHAMLELPVGKGHSMPASRMLEMVRWEMESLASEHLTQWNIGWLLLGRGYLTEAQREEVLNVLKVNADDMVGRGGRAPVRFGEEAIKREFITREQLEECLSIQEASYFLDDSIDCSWLPEPINSSDQKGLWLCGAMSSSARQKWVTAFKGQDIRLNWIYPQAGLGALSLFLGTGKQVSPVSKFDGQLYVSIERAYVVCVKIENQQITQVSMTRCSDFSLVLGDVVELCQPMLGTDIKTLWIDGLHWRIKDLASELGNLLNRSVQFIDSVQTHHYQMKTDDALASTPTSAVLCAAQHYWGFLPNTEAIRLQGHPPPPPKYRQSFYQIAACVMCFLLTVGGVEIGFFAHHQSIKNKIAGINETVEKIERANEKLVASNKDSQELTEKINELKLRKAEVKNRKESIKSVLIERQRFAEEILNVIVGRLPKEAVIFHIRETDWYVMEISGWAYSQSSVDEFNVKLSRALSAWNMYISDSPSESKSIGVSSGINGYAFTFTIKKQAS